MKITQSTHTTTRQIQSTVFTVEELLNGSVPVQGSPIIIGFHVGDAFLGEIGLSSIDLSKEVRLNVQYQAQEAKVETAQSTLEIKK